MSEYEELQRTYNIKDEELQAVIDIFKLLAEIGIESINN